MTELKYDKPILMEDLYAIEVARQGGLYTYIMGMLDRGKLTTPIRRKAGMAAKKFIFDHCKKEINLMSPRMDSLLRVTLAGLARAEDAIAILTGYFDYVDKDKLLQACIHAGAGYAHLFGVVDMWWCLGDAPKRTKFSAKYQRHVVRPHAIQAYRKRPCFDTAKGVVISLLPLPECIHCLRTGVAPTVGQATRALRKAPKGNSPQACKDYIRGVYLRKSDSHIFVEKFPVT